jgi:hypothetical protein
MVLLRKAAIPMCHSGVEEKDLFAAMLADKSTDFQKTFFDYVSKHGDKEHLKLIDDALGNGNAVIPDAAITARWRILARTAPETLFDELLQRPEPSSEFVSLIRPIVQHLSEMSLVKGTSHAAKAVRLLSVEELVKRNRLTKETAYGFLNDKSLRIREICIRHLIGLGETFQPEMIRETVEPAKASDERSPLFGYLEGEGIDVDADVYQLFGTHAYTELIEHVEWLDLEGHIAYRVLAELHFGQMAARIRSDLNDNFETLHSQHFRDREVTIRRRFLREQGRANEAGANTAIIDQKVKEAISIQRTSEQGFVEFVRSRFVAAALAGLVKNGEPSDISYARKFLLRKAGEYYGDIQVQAIKLIQRFGSKEDSDSLLEIARKSHGELKTQAIKTALQLSPGIDGCPRQLLAGDDADGFRLAVNSLDTVAWADVKPLLFPYLAAEGNSKRLDVLRCFVRRCEPAELNTLLQEYMAQGRYFYAVVCWLDRILFAPPPLKEAYLRDLQST